MNPKSSKPIFNPHLLEDQVALVTGAGKGIGRECAKQLALCGANVYAVARTQEDLDTLHAETGENLTGVQMDATSRDFLDFLAENPEITILVNNLGTNVPQLIHEVDDESLDHMLNMNVRSTVTITRAVVQNMLKQNLTGSIVNISSQMGHIGSPKRSIYCLTKHAIEGFTKALGVELAPHNIRVNSVAPTFIETPLVKPMLENKEFYDFVMSMIPMQKIGQPHDVANAVVYLVSEAANMITGTSLKVDGGWTAR
ncbi:MAG: SDR family oxidoreductase [Gammaproteobacteria bacterium]|nr:SDR family oxidoreductase [Gammaproteobacteria bacterium]NNM14688.1 SDR family oxidoreductase [Gammaproteobacteria bacterium]